MSWTTLPELPPVECSFSKKWKLQVQHELASLVPSHCNCFVRPWRFLWDLGMGQYILDHLYGVSWCQCTAFTIQLTLFIDCYFIYIQGVWKKCFIVFIAGKLTSPSINWDLLSDGWQDIHEATLRSLSGLCSLFHLQELPWSSVRAASNWKPRTGYCPIAYSCHVSYTFRSSWWTIFLLTCAETCRLFRGKAQPQGHEKPFPSQQPSQDKINAAWNHYAKYSNVPKMIKMVICCDMMRCVCMFYLNKVMFYASAVQCMIPIQYSKCSIKIFSKGIIIVVTTYSTVVPLDCSVGSDWTDPGILFQNVNSSIVLRSC